VAVAASALAALVVAAGSAAAQSVPLPPLPQPPPIPAPQPPAQAQPVFEILSPTVYPQCGAAALGVFLAGSSDPDASLLAEAAKLGLPVQGDPDSSLAGSLYDVSGPLFAICGAVPRPPAQYECLLDAQQDAILNTLESQAAGTTVPLGVHPEGTVVEQTIVVQDKLPPPPGLPSPLPNPDATSLAVQFLACAPVMASPPESNDFFPPIAQPGSEPFSGPSPASYVPGTSGTSSTTIGGTAAPTTTLPATPQPSSPVGEGVRYAAVWLLPLGLLAMFGYLGGALTRELPLPKA
jgi:hypothetical protein